MSAPPPRKAPSGILFWPLLLLLGPPAAALCYAFWPYPREAHGVQRLIANVESEYALLQRLEPGAVRRARRLDRGLRELLFHRTGLEEALQEAERPQSGADLLAAGWVRSNRDFLLAVRHSLRLTALRLAVLLGMAPLFLAAGLCMFVDGAAARHLRRLRAARESSYLYHRYKLVLRCSVLGMAACYLLPPVPLDPRWVLPPFFLTFAPALRMTTAGFKKYL